MGASEEVVEFLLEQEGLEIEKADHVWNFLLLSFHELTFVDQWVR